MKRSLFLFLIAIAVMAEESVKFTLQQCIDYAMEHSPVVAKQELAVRNQKLQTIIEEAQFDLKLSAGDSHSVQNGSDSGNLSLSKELKSGFEVRGWTNATRENGEGVTSSYVAVQLSKTLLGGGSALETQYPLEASILDELSSLNTYNRIRRKLAQDVKVAYYNVIEAQQSLLVKQRALENAKHTLALTREREKPLDILTAEIRIPENELSVNMAQRVIDNGLEQLKELMGMRIDSHFAITGDFDFAVRQFNLSEDLAFARENLETFLNNRLERKKYAWQSEIRREKSLPTVTLSATHYQYGDGDGYNFNGKDEQVVSLNLNYTFGRNEDLAQLAISRNRLETNQHDYFILDQELSVSLTSYYRRLLESAQAVTLQENLCNIQKRKEELYRDKWENGEIDILELVRTQTDLENAYVELINKKITYLQLVAFYEYTMGR